MNPVFSVNHMRHMLPIFYSVCQNVSRQQILWAPMPLPTYIQLQVAIAARLQNGPREIDMLHWMGRAALEMVGQAGLGHSFDPLVEDREDPYSQAVKGIAYVILPDSCISSVLN